MPVFTQRCLPLGWNRQTNDISTITSFTLQTQTVPVFTPEMGTDRLTIYEPLHRSHFRHKLCQSLPQRCLPLGWNRQTNDISTITSFTLQTQTVPVFTPEMGTDRLTIYEPLHRSHFRHKLCQSLPQRCLPLGWNRQTNEIINHYIYSSHFRHRLCQSLPRDVFLSAGTDRLTIYQPLHRSHFRHKLCQSLPQRCLPLGWNRQTDEIINHYIYV